MADHHYLHFFFNLTIVKFMYIYRFTSDLGQIQQYGGVKPVYGIPTPLLNNWISKANTYVNK